MWQIWMGGTWVLWGGPRVRVSCWVRGGLGDLGGGT